MPSRSPRRRDSRSPARRCVTEAGVHHSPSSRGGTDAAHALLCSDPMLTGMHCLSSPVLGLWMPWTLTHSVELCAQGTDPVAAQTR